MCFSHVNMQDHSDLKNFSSDYEKVGLEFPRVCKFPSHLLVTSYLEIGINGNLSCQELWCRETFSSIVLALLLFLLSSSPFHNKDISTIFLNLQKKTSFPECSRALPKALPPNQQLLVSASSEGKKGLCGAMRALCGGSGVGEGGQITYRCSRTPSSHREKLHSALLFPSVFKWDIKLSFSFNWCSY